MQPSQPTQSDATSQTHVMFPAIVRQHRFQAESANDELYRRIKALQNDPTIANACAEREIATVHGYQPDIVLHKHWRGDAFWERFVKTVVDPCIQDYLGEHARLTGWPARGSGYGVAASWAVLYPRGAYQAPHLHRNVFCVLAYYPRVPPRPEPEGALTFVNPHVESTYPQELAWSFHQRIQPQAGTAIVFPGWLQHYSHPHYSDDERLLLTFDVQLLPPKDR